MNRACRDKLAGYLRHMQVMWSFKKRNRNNTRMIRRQIVSRGIHNRRIIMALEQTDRILFVPEEMKDSAYQDQPVPLMPGATVSQPYIVALMSDLLDISPVHKVLEIGTGSGYQSAVLSLLASEVWSVEMQEPLVFYARERLDRTGVTNVHVVHGDGWNGYPDAAPYDRIIVTAAPDLVPPKLLEQLRPGGRMIIPTGGGLLQDLEIIEKNNMGELQRKVHSQVKFVPLVQLTIE